MRLKGWLMVGGLVLGAASPGAGLASPMLANPATALCVKNGATIATEVLPNGGQRGICVFPNGSRIDEWAYFRNKHRTLQ